MKKNYVALALGFLLLSVVVSAQSNERSSGAKGHLDSVSVTTPSIEERKLILDRDRLDFEKQKFEAETKLSSAKLEQERTAAMWSAASTILPFVAGFFTLCYSIWSFRRQASQAATFQKDSAKLQFDLKAAEIAFSGKSPEAVKNRASALKKMFGDRLPADFAKDFDADSHGGGKEASTEKMAFLDLLLKHPDKQPQIVKIWDALFSDAWLDRVKPIVSQQDTATVLSNVGPPAANPPAPV